MGLNNLLVRYFMTTLLGVLLFVGIFVVVLRIITDKNKSNVLPWNSGTGSGGSGGGSLDDRPDGTGDDSTKIKP